MNRQIGTCSGGRHGKIDDDLQEVYIWLYSVCVCVCVCVYVRVGSCQLPPRW